MLNETELAEIERRAEKCPDGPWHHKNWRVCSFPKNGVKVIVDTANNARTRTQENLDLGEFIAHARTDIPALLATIRELREESDEARTLLREITKICELLQEGESK